MVPGKMDEADTNLGFQAWYCPPSIFGPLAEEPGHYLSSTVWENIAWKAPEGQDEAEGHTDENAGAGPLVQSQDFQEEYVGEKPTMALQNELEAKDFNAF